MPPTKAFAAVASSDGYDAILNKAVPFLNVHPSRAVCKLNLTPDGAALHARCAKRIAAAPTKKEMAEKQKAAL